MVRLYTWHPAAPAEVLQGEAMPDAGHCALEVTDSEGASVCYASFWPEPETLIARLARPFGVRPSRNPESFAAECDPALPFMRRPPDHTDELPGLRENTIAVAWKRLQESPYNLRHWNCSSVAKYLLMRAMPEAVSACLRDAEHCTAEDLVQIADEGGVLEALAALPVLLVECRPQDVHRLAQAYQEWTRTPAAAAAG